MNHRSRRGFLRTLVAGTLALPAAIRSQEPGVPPARPQDTSRTVGPGVPRRRPDRRRGAAASGPPMRPPALEQGSTIAIVAPASGVSRGEVLDGAATLRNLGFNVKLGQHLGKGFGYLAARDEQRAEEYMRFVADPEVDCIMAVRGGYGVMRILPQLDFDVIRANPKIHIGYSDLTALVNPVFQHAGLVAFHGPVATSTFDTYTLDSFRRTLMTREAAGTFGESDEFRGSVFSQSRASVIVPGTATGRLVGGNLSIVTALMGTPWQVPTEGNILFLEEVAEEPYRVDRMLTQLAIGGALGACAGVVLGRFTKCEATRRGEFTVSLSLEQVLRGILEPLGIPTIYGMSIGHVRSKLTVPVGALATLDAEARTLTIDEPAVA